MPGKWFPGDDEETHDFEDWDEEESRGDDGGTSTPDPDDE
jgi:hypothetical protein